MKGKAKSHETSGTALATVLVVHFSDTIAEGNRRMPGKPFKETDKVRIIFKTKFESNFFSRQAGMKKQSF